MQFVASRLSHHDATLSIAHGLAYYGRAALLSLRKKVGDTLGAVAKRPAAQRYGQSRPRSAASSKRTGSRSPNLAAPIIRRARVSRAISGWLSQAASKASLIAAITQHEGRL